MAKKNYYAVKNGRQTGIFTAWDGPDGAKAQVIGFAGAKYKGFATREEAEAFLAADRAECQPLGGMTDNGQPLSGEAGSAKASTHTAGVPKGQDVSDGPEASKAASANLVSREAALLNLQKVSVVNDVSEQIGQLHAVFEIIASEPLPEEALAQSEAYQKLCGRYGMMLNDGLLFEENLGTDAIAFVDGGGDKSGVKQASSSIPFGVVFFEKDASGAKLYRYMFSDASDKSFCWIFHASNVSAEVIADLFVMYLCEKRGLPSVTIYQDNNLPAKYFSGEFKKIHNDADYVLQAYITESIRHLSAGRDIRFVYVPSEHSAKPKGKKAQSYEAQNVPKAAFDTAEFYNAIADVLADYRGRF